MKTDRGKVIRSRNAQKLDKTREGERWVGDSRKRAARPESEEKATPMGVSRYAGNPDGKKRRGGKKTL